MFGKLLRLVLIYSKSYFKYKKMTFFKYTDINQNFQKCFALTGKQLGS